VVHHIVLEDYIAAVEAAEARRDRLTTQIEAMLPDWTLAPVEAAWSYRFPARISRECCCSRRSNPNRSVTSPGKGKCGCAPAIAGSPGPASRPMSSPPRSPAS
jgi:hypothetical protein